MIFADDCVEVLKIKIYRPAITRFGVDPNLLTVTFPKERLQFREKHPACYFFVPDERWVRAYGQDVATARLRNAVAPTPLRKEVSRLEEIPEQEAKQ